MHLFLQCLWPELDTAVSFDPQQSRSFSNVRTMAYFIWYHPKMMTPLCLGIGFNCMKLILHILVFATFGTKNYLQLHSKWYMITYSRHPQNMIIFGHHLAIPSVVVRWPTFLSDDVLILEIDCTMLHLPPLTTVKDKVKLTMISSL